MKRTSETRIQQVLNLMQDGKPRSTSQAAEEMRAEDPCSVSTAISVAFRRKQLHIVDWVRRRHAGGSLVPVYQIGDGENAPRPPRMSPAEYRKVQSEREMQERERLAAERARPVMAFRHWQDVALYGEHRSAV